MVRKAFLLLIVGGGLIGGLASHTARAADQGFTPETIAQWVNMRVGRDADLPEAGRQYLKSEARLGLEPPQDITEIRRLQQ